VYCDLIVSAFDKISTNIAIYSRCGGIFNIHLTTNLPRNLIVIFLKIG